MIKGNNDKFDSIEEFIDFFRRGGELEFTYNERNYSITHWKNKLVFIEQHKEDTEKRFSTVDELLNYRIDRKKLNDIVTEIQPFFRTF